MKISKTLIIIFLAASFIGFLDAAYLTIQHYLGVVPPCAITGGCATVLTSAYQKIFGIQVALLGAIYYLALFLLTIAYLTSGRKALILLAALATPIGFIASLWFVCLQLFVIKAICFYCMISALTSTTLFVVGIMIIINYRKPMLTKTAAQNNITK